MLKITVKPHSYFRRDGFDVLTDAYVSVTDAILGGTVKVRTLNSNVEIKVDPGTTHNSKKKMLNLGIQKLPPNQNMKGNQIVTFKIEIPKRLTPEQKKILESYRDVETQVKSNA